MILIPLILGLLVGGFVNVLARRLPNGVRLLAWPVRCRYCRLPLGILDVLPLAGTLLANGKCRYCGHSLPMRPLLVELATAAIYTSLYLRFGASWTGLIYGVYCTVLATVFLTDLEHFLIPNAITYPSIGLALALMYFTPGLGVRGALLGGLFYGGLFLALYLLSIVVYKKQVALGLGDVKLALFIGLITGMPGAVTAAFLGTALGAIAGLSMMIARRAHAKSILPYGTTLSLGAFITILWSPWIT